MKLDVFTTIGKNHKTCDDYIISGEEPFKYIILSDGCSSSQQTDMGARILCHVAEKLLKDKIKEDTLIDDQEEFGEAVIHRSKAVAEQLNLNDTALDATLIIAYTLDNNSIKYFIYGDGNVSFFNNGYLQCNSIYFEPNAPKYLSYRLSKRREEQYKDMNVKKFVKRYSPNMQPDILGLPLGNDGYCTSNKFFTQLNFGGTLFSTDGIESFLSPQKTIGILDVVKIFTGFKSTAGEFLKRRANRGLIELSQEGFHNYDDLSMGCFLKEEA